MSTDKHLLAINEWEEDGKTEREWWIEHPHCSWVPASNDDREWAGGYGCVAEAYGDAHDIPDAWTLPTGLYELHVRYTPFTWNGSEPDDPEITFEIGERIGDVPAF